MPSILLILSKICNARSCVSPTERANSGDAVISRHLQLGRPKQNLSASLLLVKMIVGMWPSITANMVVTGCP
jgi:hypothetical protein